MRLIHCDWFCTYPYDFEHKKWLLLSFIKDINNDFDKNILYPSIDQIKFQLSNLNKWKTSRELYLKKELKGIDFEKMTLIYDIPEDSDEIKEINDIVDYAIEELEEIYKKGSKIWRKIYNEIIWNKIGIIPEYTKEGYIIINIKKTIWIYSYSHFLGSVTLQFIDKKEFNFFNTPLNIKLDLIQRNKSLPNPLCLLLECPEFPLEETLIPIIKSNLLNKI